MTFSTRRSRVGPRQGEPPPTPTFRSLPQLRRRWKKSGPSGHSGRNAFMRGSVDGKLQRSHEVRPPLSEGPRNPLRTAARTVDAHHVAFGFTKAHRRHDRVGGLVFSRGQLAVLWSGRRWFQCCGTLPTRLQSRRCPRCFERRDKLLQSPRHDGLSQLASARGTGRRHRCSHAASVFRDASLAWSCQENWSRETQAEARRISLAYVRYPPTMRPFSLPAVPVRRLSNIPISSAQAVERGAVGEIEV